VIPSGGTVPNLGVGELVIILLIVILIFGGSRLPQIGDGIGKAIKNFKRGLNTDEDIEVTPKDKRVAEKSTTKSAKDEIAEAEVEASKSKTS
jgi:sec-independent protein translocase protein TatA